MIYAIGDIHGQYDMLKELYNIILEDIVISGDEENKIIFLGDYIDRGKQNIKVLDFISQLQNKSNIENIFLLGNHEQIFMEAMESPLDKNKVYMWINNGGLNFMHESGNVEWDYFHQTFPWGPYVRWFQRNLQKYHETEDYIFVHGGLDIRQPHMAKQDAEYLIWARHLQKDWYSGFHKLVVHGHTPSYDAMIDKNRINVDTSVWNPAINGRKLIAVALKNRLHDGPPRILNVQKID